LYVNYLQLGVWRLTWIDLARGDAPMERNVPPVVVRQELLGQVRAALSALSATNDQLGQT
jgi:hypothetical protein